MRTHAADQPTAVGAARRGRMQKRDSKLVQYDELKDAVIANAVKNVPQVKKEKKREENHSLSDFSN